MNNKMKWNEMKRKQKKTHIEQKHFIFGCSKAKWTDAGGHKQTNNINNKRNMIFFSFPISMQCINSNINCSRVFIPKIDSHHRSKERKKTYISLLYIEWQLNLMINCCIFCELNFYLEFSLVLLLLLLFELQNRIPRYNAIK